MCSRPRPPSPRSPTSPRPAGSSRPDGSACSSLTCPNRARRTCATGCGTSSCCSPRGTAPRRRAGSRGVLVGSAGAPQPTGRQRQRAAATAPSTCSAASTPSRRVNGTAPGTLHCSLRAVAAACEALNSGEYDLVLAGGVAKGVGAWAREPRPAGRAAEQHVRVYDASPTGMFPGEGCGMVALRRAADIRAARVPAYAEIIGWHAAGPAEPQRGGAARRLRARRDRPGGHPVRRGPRRGNRRRRPGGAHRAACGARYPPGGRRAPLRARVRRGQHRRHEGGSRDRRAAQDRLRHDGGHHPAVHRLRPPEPPAARGRGAVPLPVGPRAVAADPGPARGGQHPGHRSLPGRPEVRPGPRGAAPRARPGPAPRPAPQARPARRRAGS